MNNHYSQREYDLRVYQALMDRPADDKFANFILKRDYGEGDFINGYDDGETIDGNKRE